MGRWANNDLVHFKGTAGPSTVQEDGVRHDLLGSMYFKGTARPVTVQGGVPADLPFVLDELQRHCKAFNIAGRQ